MYLDRSGMLADIEDEVEAGAGAGAGFELGF